MKQNNLYTPGRSIKHYENLHNGETVHIRSNGPSIEDIMFKKELGDKTIDVNGAIGEYNSKDYVCAIHPSKSLFERCFKDISGDSGKTNGIELLASTVCNRFVIEKWLTLSDKIRFFNTADSGDVKKEVYEYTGYPIIPAGLTVAVSAIRCAIYMGFKTIHLWGVDCGYSKDGKKYAYEEPIKAKDLNPTYFISADKKGLPRGTEEVMVKTKELILQIIREHKDIEFLIHGDGLLFWEEKLDNVDYL